jgi:phage baseplate assembly protein W
VDVDFPLHFDSRGQTATAAEADHVRDLLEQLIFTTPGERVNRPDFGSGVLQLVFAPNSPELAATVQFTLLSAIQRWLGDVVEVGDLTVEADDATLRVQVDYRIRRTGEGQTAVFTRDA